jgi:O-acetyl-ADP-ribose deacetylase (regulator of RNase III)
MLTEIFKMYLYGDNICIIVESDSLDHYPSKDEIENFIKKNKNNNYDSFLVVEKRYVMQNQSLIKEVNQDLFEVDMDEYVLAHCVSLDFAMGAGIAKEFTNVFSCIKEYCKLVAKKDHVDVGTALRYQSKDEGIVYNLITKEKYWQKVEKHFTQDEYLENLKLCLVDMIDQMEENNETKLAIPKLGCGLDRCNWDDVKKVIEDVFKGSNIEVLVCSLE